MIKKLAILIIVSAGIGIIGSLAGFNTNQAIIISVFASSILGSMFFWDFRISFVFIGSGVLFFLHAINIENFIHYASLDVILFLVGMMIIVGALKGTGLFLWIITLLLRTKNLTGKKLFWILIFLSFILSNLMGEVSSILIILVVIFHLSEFLDIDPVPMTLSSVIATNIGSAATVLGNPIGILIAVRSKLSFGDFIFNAFPISFLVLIVAGLVLTLLYKNHINVLDRKLKPYVENRAFIYLISVPPDRHTKIGLAIFIITVLCIALHRVFENILGIEHNSALIMIPVVFAGIVLLYDSKNAQNYIEKEVEWNSLLFFMFLFAEAGVVRSAGIGELIAQKATEIFCVREDLLVVATLLSSGLLSSVLDNVVVVNMFIPILVSLKFMNATTLWWALLFGGCYGGNITMIGSTANIVALGLLSKNFNKKMQFFEWLKVGTIVGLISFIMAAVVLLWQL